MTVDNFAKATGFDIICMPSPERVIKGAYIGDLLSWVMGRAEADNIWITIMSNINIVAVATLADVSCILLSEGVTVDAEIISVATSKGVNILSSSLPSYEVAKIILGKID